MGTRNVVRNKNQGMNLIHEEIDELLAAHALTALPPLEAWQVEAHLGTCSYHRESAAALTRAAAGLALAVQEREPSPELRERILEALRIEASPASRRRTRAVISLRQPPRWWRPTVTAVAASFLLAFLGGVAVDRFAIGARQPSQLAWVFVGNNLAPNAVATLTYFRGRKQAVLATKGFPPLAQGKLYEIWLLKNGTPVDVGTSVVDGGKLVVTMDRDLSQYQQIAITAEPSEQPRPTGTPVLEGSLTGA